MGDDQPLILAGDLNSILAKSIWTLGDGWWDFLFLWLFVWLKESSSLTIMEGCFVSPIIWIITWSFHFFSQSESLAFLLIPQPSRELSSTWPGFFRWIFCFSHHLSGLCSQNVFFFASVELLATKSFGQNAKNTRGLVARKCLEKMGNNHKLRHNLTDFVVFGVKLICDRLALRHAVAWWKISRFCRMRVVWGLWITDTRWLVEGRVDSILGDLQICTLQTPTTAWILADSKSLCFDRIMFQWHGEEGVDTRIWMPNTICELVHGFRDFFPVRHWKPTYLADGEWWLQALLPHQSKRGISQ